MTSSTMVHLDKDESYDVDVRHSLEGKVSLGIRDICLFCTPEQALKLAADILQGVLSLPPLTEKEQAEQVSPF